MLYLCGINERETNNQKLKVMAHRTLQPYTIKIVGRWQSFYEFFNLEDAVASACKWLDVYDNAKTAHVWGRWEEKHIKIKKNADGTFTTVEM